MSLQAYTRTLETTENSRNTEYRLMAQITGELMEAAKSGKVDAPLAEALNRNRQLWQALANDCRGAGNGLADELRASIISLSIWVTKYSGQVLREGEDIKDLIEVNRIVMQGLQPKAPAAEPTSSATWWQRPYGVGSRLSLNR